MGLFTQLNLPPEMTGRDQWICWKTEERNGKDTKVPINPNTREYGRSNDPSTWSSYEVADKLSSTLNHGLGFVFSKDDPFVGIDLDDYRYPDNDNSEAMDPVAEEIIVKLNSYTEVSPSGTGYHVIVQGELPNGRNRRGGIEMYDHGRFFTVTGDRVENTPFHVNKQQRKLEVVHAKFVAEPDKAAAAAEATPDEQLDIDNEQIITKAKDSASGNTFKSLWNGRTGGYNSHSEADLALCSYLAFWTGGDENQMDSLFRKSGLYRDKWDKVHSSDGKTYGEMTIQKAIATSTDFYTGGN